jgi:anti-sigma B factor antagonist
MSARDVNQGRAGFQIRRYGKFAVAGFPDGRDVLTAPALAGELCAVLDEGGPGLIVDLSGAGFCDSACLNALMRAAQRARGWQSWLRVVIPDHAARTMVRLVALDGVMPVHASVAEAVTAACLEAITAGPSGSPPDQHQLDADPGAQPDQQAR